jgi:hypothetical protein
MRTIILTSLLALAVSVTDASAACKQANLAGIWHYLGSDVVVNDDLSPVFSYLGDCTFRITAAGVARNASCPGGTPDVPWGNTTFKTNPDCSIESKSSDLCGSTITGQIARNKQIVSGNAFCCCYEDVPGSGNFVLSYTNAFTLVKTTPAPAASLGAASTAAQDEAPRPGAPPARAPR